MSSQKKREERPRWKSNNEPEERPRWKSNNEPEERPRWKSNNETEERYVRYTPIRKGLIGVPSEITKPEAIEAYKKALEEGSKSVHRSRLMFVGQERVGKTSLMRNLTKQSFNSDESSTEGIDTSSHCNIDITHAKEWTILHGKRDDPAGLKKEYLEGVAEAMDQNMKMQKAPAVRIHGPEDAVISQDEQVPIIAKEQIDPEVVDALAGIRRRQFFDPNPKEGVIFSIWDFAGQDLYYTTHQTFFSSRAVYVVVFNLSHDLDKPIPGTGAVKSACEMTPIQYLDFWMRSVYTYTKENITKNKLELKPPPIVIVGTHRDSVGGADLPDKERKKMIRKIFERVRQEINHKPYSSYVVRNFHAIENSLGYSNQKIRKLRDHIGDIARKEPYMGEEIPLHWLQFDKNKLKEVAKCTDHDGPPVLSLDEVRVNSGVKSEAELQAMLTFYHDIGHIVYFGGGDGDSLRDVVILDPQWLIDAFKKVITVMPPREQMSGLTESWLKLKEYGILKNELIEHMWRDFPGKIGPLLRLMKKFDLLCERVDQVSYYVPSMLQKRTPSASSPTANKDPTTSANVFFVDFEAFLPDGLFHRLVVRALRWSQKMPGGKDPILEYYEGTFFVDVQHEFVLQMERENDQAYIRVSVILVPKRGSKKSRTKEERINRRKTPSPGVTQKVLEFVKNELQNLKDLWIKRINYSLAVQCPCDRGSIHFLPLDECLEETSVACRTEKPQVEIPTDQFKAMFEQEISAVDEFVDTVDRRPMSDIHLERIADRLGKEWKRLAIVLGFHKGNIYQFEVKSNNFAQGQISSMLQAWKHRMQPQNVEKMTEVLVKALKEVDRYDVAEEVENYTGAEADTTSD